ncbi:MAG: hypothetical protein QXU18_15670 [Thermoplasmatales archaeon]
MSTKFTYKGRNIEPQCVMSRSDNFPSYDFLDGNSKEDYVDLVCNASHFVRMNIELDNNGNTVLKNGNDSKIISAFVDQQKPNYSKMPDFDKEMFENFVSFTSIKRTYGAALSMRILMENFLKDNFLAPAIHQYLSTENQDKLFKEAKLHDAEYLSFALHRITFNHLLDTIGDLSPPPKAQNRLTKFWKVVEESVVEYISTDSTGKKKKLSKNEISDLKDLHKYMSSVVHGARYDALQVFTQSKVFFNLLTSYFKIKGLVWK